MIKLVSKVFIFLFSFFLFIDVNSQVKGLKPSDSKKIERAESKISKAEAIVDKQEKFAPQIKEYESLGKVRKLERFKTKANRIVIKSSSYFKDGYGQKYKVYKNAIKRERNEDSLPESVSKQLQMANKAYKIGRKWRRKSEAQADVNKGVEYLMKANGIEKDAIVSLEKVLDKVEIKEIEDEVAVIEEVENDTIAKIIAEEISEEELSVIPNEVIDSIPQHDSLMVQHEALLVDSTALDSSVPDSALVDSAMVTTTEAVLVTEEVPLQVKPAIEEKVVNTYFTVQFLAEKQPVPKETIINLYDGPFEVVKHEADGWFKYSFGKFKSLDEAKDMLSKSGVRGYVVAYHNNKRISTREALVILTQ